MSRKFVGKLIRIMMTKSSSCDILKKKRTIRRGSGSRPKGPYLMDLRFWNYVIPDGSTTIQQGSKGQQQFWNYVIPDGSTTCWLTLRFSRCFGTMSFQMVLLLYRYLMLAYIEFWNYVIPDGSTTDAWAVSETVEFWNYVIPDGSTTAGRSLPALRGFGTMSFQMVLLHAQFGCSVKAGFGTMSFQMVLLLRNAIARATIGFGTMSFQMVLLLISSAALPDDGFGTMSFQMVLLRK